MIDPKATLTFLPVQLSRNRLVHTIEALDPETHPDRSGLRYLLTLIVPEFPQALNFVTLPTLEGREKPPVTLAGATTYEGAFFEFDALLDGFLSLQKPQFRQATLSVLATLTMPYKLTEQVLPGGAVVEREPKWVLKGGIAQEDEPGWAERFFDQYQADARQFLTWQPDEKTVGPRQEEYLYFLLNCSPVPTEVRLRAETTRADGQIAESTLLTLKGVMQYQVICAPVGPAIVGAGPADANPIRQYRVWLANTANERLSQVRTYRIDERYRRTERHILFSNSLGGYDTLRLVGSGTGSLKVQRTSAERERPADASDFSELYIVDVVGERSLTVSTGFFERGGQQTLRYLDELLLAREWYLITDKGHIPLELLTTDLVDHEDDSELVARQFTFRQVAPELSYSDLPVAPAQAARPTGWRGVGVMHVLDEWGKRTGYGRPIRLQKYYLDDGSVYKPLTQKPNTPGDPDFQDQQPLIGIVAGTTPYPNALISRPGSYVRSNCPAGQVGGPATIVIPAAKYGGESAGEADRRAEAEFRLLDTPDYADANGTCVVAPEIYAWAVPTGHWHYRTNKPGQIGIVHWGAPMGIPNIGNSWDVQGEARPYCFAPWTNDLDFPPRDQHWHAFVYGPPSGNLGLKIYRNGLLVVDNVISLNHEGTNTIILGITPAAGDKYYIRIE